MQNINTLEHWNSLWPVNLMVHASDPYSMARFSLVASLCMAGTTILDVCSGPGHIHSYLPPGVIYERLDFCEIALRAYPGSYFVNDVLSLTALPGLHHTVLAMEILEHLDNPALFIPICMAGAIYQVIFTVPNNRLGPDQCPEHVRIWNRISFIEFLKPFCPEYRVVEFATEGNIICQILK